MLVGDGVVSQEYNALSTDGGFVKGSVASGENSASNVVYSSKDLASVASMTASHKSAVASQRSAVSGGHGYFLVTADAPENTMSAAAGFDGEGGSVSSDVTALAAGSRAGIAGSANVMGIDAFGDNSMGIVSSDDISMEVSGAYSSGNGLGNFGATVSNVEKSGVAGTGPQKATIVQGTYRDYNDPNAYKLQDYRWKSNPCIAFYVRDDSNLRSEGLSAAAAANAIAAGAQTWDAAVAQDLFADTVPRVSTAVYADRYDQTNVHAFKYVSSTALAYSRTYYYTSRYVTGADGKSYKQAIESDMIYNTRYDWTTDLQKATTTGALDLQSVATHEMGHTVGMGDTYTDPVLKYDFAQIMGYYNAPQRSLGAGDLTGIRKLYGA